MDFVSILPLVLIFVVFYFLLIRPQQKRMKEHRAMIEAIRRGDTVTTGGGIIGKVTKVIDDNTVQVEIAEGVRVRVVKATVTEVRTKGEPVKETAAKTEGVDKSDAEDEDAPPAASAPAEKKSSLFSRLKR